MGSRIALIIIVLVTLSGCRREIPNPESLDPIYSDLRTELEVAEKALEAATKELETAQKDLAKSKIRTIDRTIALDTIKKAQAKITYATQAVEFYKIRVARRLVEGRAAYRTAFAEGKDWPDPEEFKAYQTNKRLRQAPRSWTGRLEDLKFNAEKEMKAKEATEK